MDLTQDRERYVARVSTKIKDFVRSGIWDGPSISSIGRWMSNFPDDEGKFLAAWIADHLLFYSERDVQALLRCAYFERLRQLTADGWQRLAGESALAVECRWRTRFQDTENATLVCPGGADAPASSGNVMVRALRQLGLVDDHRQARPEALPTMLRTGRWRRLFIVDDIVGTGSQAVRYYRETQSFCPELRATIATLVRDYHLDCTFVSAVATLTGLAKLRESGICAIAGEVLGPEWDVQQASFWRECSMPDALARLRAIAARGGVCVHGFGGMSLTVCFHHGVPNNTTPLLTANHASWSPLFPQPA